VRIIGGAIVVLAGSVVFAAVVVSQAIQLTVDKNFNFHPFGVDVGVWLGLLLCLIGLAVLASGFWENRRPKGPPL
jgi:hypothetical protein